MKSREYNIAVLKNQVFFFLENSDKQLSRLSYFAFPILDRLPESEIATTMEISC